ncbi:hypothetical protein JKP88DRAFT_255678 [Tribonema minus]|uniref:Uncharacterized protein n=1 Tax=Tribonema minus TaxID=303371 RepID=A0A836CHE7_9STRA|nr:hypothetical protein JKP88DRAFT_255678 [Tribonema minus]
MYLHVTCALVPGSPKSKCVVITSSTLSHIMYPAYHSCSYGRQTASAQAALADSALMSMCQCFASTGKRQQLSMQRLARAGLAAVLYLTAAATLNTTTAVLRINISYSSNTNSCRHLMALGERSTTAPSPPQPQATECGLTTVPGPAQQQSASSGRRLSNFRNLIEEIDLQVMQHKEIVVITGRGVHSADGLPKRRPLVIALFQVSCDGCIKNSLYCSAGHCDEMALRDSIPVSFAGRDTETAFIVIDHPKTQWVITEVLDHKGAELGDAVCTVHASARDDQYLLVPHHLKVDTLHQQKLEHMR